MDISLFLVQENCNTEQKNVETGVKRRIEWTREMRELNEETARLEGMKAQLERPIEEKLATENAELIKNALH